MMCFSRRTEGFVCLLLVNEVRLSHAFCRQSTSGRGGVLASPVMRSLLLIALCLVAVAFAFVPPHALEWESVGRADLTERVTFHVALKQRNVAELEELALEISDPVSPKYRNYLTPKEINDIVAPSKESKEAVLLWATSAGYVNLVEHPDALKVTVTVEQAEKLFATQFHQWKHTKSDHTSVRIQPGGTLHISEEIQELIDFVTGLVDFPKIKKANKATSGPSPAGSNYPAMMRQRYNIPADLNVTNVKTSQAVVEFGGQPAPFVKDVQLWAKSNNLPYNAYVQIVGPYNQGGGGESTLDVELISALAPNAQNWYWTVSDGWAWEMALQLLQQANPPLVVSVSYGWPERLTCDASVTQANCTHGNVEAYVTRANTELAKVAAIGLSVIVADQDEGAPSEANLECLSVEHAVNAIYPSSSPWVTAVSSTTMVGTTNGDTSQLPPICSGQNCFTNVTGEIVTNAENGPGWTTGGGFSLYGARPSYQTAQVAAYLANKQIKFPKKFSSTMRGYPDVSSVGDKILISIGGGTGQEAGTSASTPIFAGIASLLNDHELNAGKKPLGFLNPLLYKMASECPTCFHDITVGTNACTTHLSLFGKCSERCEGYAAVPNWDAASGLGSPNFGEMVKYLEKS